MKNLHGIWKIEVKQQPSCSEDLCKAQGACCCSSSLICRVTWLVQRSSWDRISSLLPLDFPLQFPQVLARCVCAAPRWKVPAFVWLELRWWEKDMHGSSSSSILVCPCELFLLLLFTTWCLAFLSNFQVCQPTVTSGLKSPNPEVIALHRHLHQLPPLFKV